MHSLLPVFDETLVSKFHEGDNKALQQIFQQYYKPLILFANKLINDLPQAEDITAESFYKLYMNREEMQSLAHIKAFLFMANRNAALDWLKTSRRHQAAHQQIKYLSDASYAPHQQQYDKEALTEIQRNIQNLPTQCGQVFKMIFYEGKQTHEIAATLGISGKTVLNQKLKAIRLLRAALAKKDLLSVIIVFSCLAN